MAGVRACMCKPMHEVASMQSIGPNLATASLWAGRFDPDASCRACMPTSSMASSPQIKSSCLEATPGLTQSILTTKPQQQCSQQCSTRR